MRLFDFHYEKFADLVRGSTGIIVSGSRRRDLEKAVQNMLKELGLATADELYSLLSDPARGSSHLESFIGSLTVGETHFFRNPSQMQALEDHILPDLIARRRDRRRMKVWSAGCASGEEAYSLAILLERLLPDPATWDIAILGTDIDARALKKARRGVYGKWSLRGVPGEISARYFTAHGHEYKIEDRVRESVRFASLNLAEAAYPSLVNGTADVDLILCRNVLMYLHEDTVGAIMQRFLACLADDGWLMVGHAEPWDTISKYFAGQASPAAFAFRKGTLNDRKTQAEPGRGRPSGRNVGGRDISGGSRQGGQTRAVQTANQPDASAEVASTHPHEEAVALGRACNVHEALSRLQHLAQDERNALAPYLAARVCADRLQLDEALQWLDTALDREALLAPAHYLRGLILHEQGRWADALGALRRCLYADPSLVVGYFALGCLHGRMGNVPRADKVLGRAARLLQDVDENEALVEGDGLTAGGMLELIEVHRRLLGATPGARASK